MEPHIPQMSEFSPETSDYAHSLKVFTRTLQLPHMTDSVSGNVLSMTSMSALPTALGEADRPPGAAHVLRLPGHPERRVLHHVLRDCGDQSAARSRTVAAIFERLQVVGDRRAFRRQIKAGSPQSTMWIGGYPGAKLGTSLLLT